MNSGERGGQVGERPAACVGEVDRLCDDFERQWKAGRLPDIANYLARVDAPRQAELLRELISLEVEYRRRGGEAPAISEYQQRFPQQPEAVQAAWQLLTSWWNAAAEQVRQVDSRSQNTDAPVPSEPDTVGEATSQTVPTQFGRYQIQHVLGTGGFGIVYRAVDPQLQHTVALKVPHRSWIGSAQCDIYLHEARTAAQLKHPGLVAVYDVQQEGNSVYIVQEYVDGQDLARWAQAERPDVARITHLMLEIVEAVGYAHQQGLVHRDLKPANILVDRRGHAHVADFGLALQENAQQLRAGETCGTPAYMSPEQVRGETHRLDGRSDLWSLGVIFYELLTGRRPFTANTTSVLFDEIQHRDPKPPRMIEPAIPAELERVTLKCLAKRATDRYGSAAALAEDLQAWLAGGTESHQTRVQEPTAAAAPRVVPKGLRSFDAQDADFFLDLLPGPRDREGLPESIRFFKTRIEETDADCSFSVGLIYGPSGCGKSSLVKAGLLPRLASHVAVVYLEASAEDSEPRLLKGLQKIAPDVPAEISLPELLAGVREGRWMTGGRKTLIVLDQFEQWLHARRSEHDTQLVQSLRHCDGSRLQAIVMVRDDFWMPATRFMRDLEVPVVENQNSTAVDLFDPLHARQVLTAFGRAYGRLPDDTTELSQDQKMFLDQAVEGLAQDGKVICVRLALFGEMLKGKPWTPKTLAQVGGTEGLGVTFLEETFSATTAPASHRYHQQAAQSVLKALLPEVGSDIKGGRQPYDALRAASGYARRTEDFADLMQLLDSELRLITPVAAACQSVAVADPDAEPVAAREKYYQLTHDYLVPSLRDWLTRKQKETRRGRAELRLAERAALWNAKPENQQLPSWWEDLSIRSLTDRTKWTEPQRKMMRRAGWVHGSRTLFAAILLLELAWGGFEIHGRFQASKVLAADPSTLPGAIAQLSPWQMWGQRSLADIIQHPPQDDDERREQLHARLALASLSGTYDPELLTALYDCSLPYVGVIRNVLQPHRDQFAASLWSALIDASQPAQRRFRSGLLLAGCDPSSSQWQPEDYRFLTEQLLDTSFEFQDMVRQYLRPLRDKVVPQLESYLGNEAVRESWQVSAATALADPDFSGADGATLADWLTKASDNQYAKLHDLFEAKVDPQALSRLRQLVEQTPTDETQAERVKLGRRRAGAAITLLGQSGRDEVPEDMFAVLRVTDDPESLSQFVHGCRAREITAEQLWQCVVRTINCVSRKRVRSGCWTIACCLVCYWPWEILRFPSCPWRPRTPASRS